jgi:hypothetical protein
VDWQTTVDVVFGVLAGLAFSTLYYLATDDDEPERE